MNEAHKQVVASRQGAMSEDAEATDQAGPSKSRPLSARDAQAVLVQQLFSDVDQLLARLERVAPAVEAAADRLERALQAAPAGFQASADTAKASVGAWIVKTANDTTAHVLQAHRAAIAEAVATELGRGLLAAQAPLRDAATRTSGKQVSGWTAGALGAACAVIAMLALQFVVGLP